MKILILRHGQANPAPAHETDFERELSERGRAEIEKNYLNYADKLPMLDRVWASPLKRAQQTALEFCKLYAQQRSIALKIQTKDFIKPDDDLMQVFTQLQAFTHSTILLVTHQPLASSFLDKICGAPLGFHAMSTASMAYVNCEFPAPGLGTLEWIEHPN